MTISTHRSVKVKDGVVKEMPDVLTVEQALSISVNGVSYTVTMQTPGNEKELARGILFSEDVYSHRLEDPVIQIKSKAANGYIASIDVIVSAFQLGKGADVIRNIMSVSSCGICGKSELEMTEVDTVLPVNEKVPGSVVKQMFDCMNSGQDTFLQSGGSHASAAFTANGELLCMHEDIGRHNAVDKVIGDLLFKRQLDKAKCLIVSGRVSYEIVNKCYIAGIPLLAAVSAPSSLAVEMSEKMGITLLGFCRENKYTIYSCASRIDLEIKNTENNAEKITA